MVAIDGRPAANPRVIVVDDHAGFRKAACELLARRGYAVVGDVGDAAVAIDAVDRLAPDALLVDVCLGADDGFDLCRVLTRSRPGLAVLLVSTSDYSGYASLLRSSGARGFVLKSRLPSTDLTQFWPARQDGGRPDA